MSYGITCVNNMALCGTLYSEDSPGSTSHKMLIKSHGQCIEKSFVRKSDNAKFDGHVYKFLGLNFMV